MGFEVDVLIDTPPPPVKRNLLIHRLKNVYRRIFYKDTAYYQRLETKIFKKFAEKRMKNKCYDIAFVIRADMYSEKLIKKIRYRNKK